VARIFISYKRVDKTKVFRIKDQVESALGEKCWIDLDGIESDAQFKNVIIKAINECEVVLFMYSQAHSEIIDFEKDWTVRELNFASKKNKRIVFVNIDGSPLTDAFEFDFGTKQQIDATNSDAVNKLIVDLLRWLGTPLCNETISERAIVNNKFEYIDLGLSVKWATCNLGASKPWESGRYFAWGDVQGQTWNGSAWSSEGFSNYPASEVDVNGNLMPEYDAAHVLLGGSWRMPTRAECQELIDNCTSTWTSNYNGTGVAGRIFTSNKTGYTDKSIFLPAAGRGSDSYLRDADSRGSYWSSTFDDDISAWYLSFFSDLVYTFDGYRDFGLSVRPVSEY